MRGPERHGRNERGQGNAEFKAALYALVHRGVVGLLTWVFRREISDAAARYLTIGAALAAWIAALVVLAVANRNDITLLRGVAIYAVLGIPLFALVAWVLRTQRDVLAAEHGRDSEAYREKIEAGHQDGARTAMRDDWVLDPPWRRVDGKRRPRFGNKSR